MASTGAALPLREPVTILPLGDTSFRRLEQLVLDLGAKGIVARLAEPIELPASAYERSRGQYRAEALLALARQLPWRHVLGVTERDLYAAGLNFVFGMAESPGRAALISLFRLGIQADANVARARAVKEAVHELGHTLGLGHCPDPCCVMRFSNSLADTDAKGSELCAACHEKLAHAAATRRR